MQRSSSAAIVRAGNRASGVGRVTGRDGQGQAMKHSNSQLQHRGPAPIEESLPGIRHVVADVLGLSARLAHSSAIAELLQRLSDHPTGRRGRVRPVERVLIGRVSADLKGLERTTGKAHSGR